MISKLIAWLWKRWTGADIRGGVAITLYDCVKCGQVTDWGEVCEKCEGWSDIKMENGDA